MKRNAHNICPWCDAGDPTSVVIECGEQDTMSREKYLLTLLCDSLYWDGRLGEYVTENDLADVF